MSTKESNPKQAFGDVKLPLGLVPTTAIAVECLAILDGMLKYGHVNWREVGVRASTYYHAERRHMQAYWEGQDLEPVTGIPHLAYARACLAILIDAGAHGKLEDDRPMSGGYIEFADKLVPIVLKLRELHADENPRHYTVADNPPPATTVAPP